MKHNEEKKPADSYYKLHTEAVDDLVGATEENTPKYSKEELAKYKSTRGKWKFPEKLKVFLIKWWFYGAVCFFVFMGLGLYLGDQLDLLFVAAVIMGMVGDLLINRFLRFTEKMPGGSKRYMMVTLRGAKGFFCNILYAGVLLFFTVTLYGAINGLLGSMGGYLGVEPVGFGILVTLSDSLLLGLKGMFLKIIADAGRK
ncbi:MAG: hypothetical protein E7324_06470 [Clostridiales bacterium]|nr:hypothetical protein [Clostridiales bacterium]